MAEGGCKSSPACAGVPPAPHQHPAPLNPASLCAVSSPVSSPPSLCPKVHSALLGRGSSAAWALPCPTACQGVTAPWQPPCCPPRCPVLTQPTHSQPLALPHTKPHTSFCSTPQHLTAPPALLQKLLGALWQPTATQCPTSSLGSCNARADQPLQCPIKPPNPSMPHNRPAPAVSHKPPSPCSAP